jgi:FMN-dependent NADH-azoreductase
VPYLTGEHMAAFQGAPVTDAALADDLATGNGYIDELLAADIIIIGAPMYNFSIPA